MGIDRPISMLTYTCTGESIMYVRPSLVGKCAAIYAPFMKILL